MIGAVGADIGPLVPSSDQLSRWMFALCALTDDLTVLDHHLHGSWDDAGSPTVMYFPLIVTRLSEGERVVTAMDAHATIADFLGDIPEAPVPCGRSAGLGT